MAWLALVLMEKEGELTPYIHMYSDGFYESGLEEERRSYPEEFPEPELELEVPEKPLSDLFFQTKIAVNMEGVPSSMGSLLYHWGQNDVGPDYSSGDNPERLKDFLRKQAEISGQ